MGAKRVIWRIGLAVAALLTVCSPAHAFYWFDWPGSRIRVQPTIITPPNQHAPGNPPSVPPVQPPPFTPPPGTGVPPPPVGPPEQTPEPSTGLIGLLGLGAVAVRRWWKSRS